MVLVTSREATKFTPKWSYIGKANNLTRTFLLPVVASSTLSCHDKQPISHPIWAISAGQGKQPDSKVYSAGHVARSKVSVAGCVVAIATWSSCVAPIRNKLNNQSGLFWHDKHGKADNLTPIVPISAWQSKQDSSVSVAGRVARSNQVDIQLDVYSLPWSSPSSFRLSQRVATIRRNALVKSGHNKIGSRLNLHCWLEENVLVVSDAVIWKTYQSHCCSLRGRVVSCWSLHLAVCCLR